MTILSPRESLSRADRTFEPTRRQLDRFKDELFKVLDHGNPSGSEEHHKKLIAAFLMATYYSPSFHINTKGSIDLVIHTGA